MNVKHVYCVPKQNQVPEQDDGEVVHLLSMVKRELGIPFERRVLSKRSEVDQFRRTLVHLSVSERLRVHQTSKSKMLYPHLLVLAERVPVAFFPQIRREKSRRIEVGVSEYLTSLLSGSLESLVSIPSIEQKIPRREKVNEALLKRGYLEMAAETRRVSKEWTTAETAWPD